MCLPFNPHKSPLQAFLPALIEATTGLSPRARYLVGVSGGADSMALLQGLLQLGFHHLVVCHLNHGLRLESATEADWVQHQADSLQLTCLTGKADVSALAKERGLSIETAARVARHAFFADCARQTRCRRLLLAHHRDDQIETILHHFFRGSGKRGLGGMQARSELRVGRLRLEVLRPLLLIDRACARAWLTSAGWTWCEDASNASPAHTRNRLRHDLIPRLEQILGRDFRSPVLRLSAILAEEDAFLESLIEALPWTTDSASLQVKELRKLHPALQRRVLLRWLKSQNIEAGFREVAAVQTLLEPAGPARVNLPEEHHARRSRGEIYLEGTSKNGNFGRRAVLRPSG